MPRVAEEVWIAATYATAIMFEVVKVLLTLERSVRHALFGAQDELPPRPSGLWLT